METEQLDLFDNMDRYAIEDGITTLTRICHDIAAEKGWWDKSRAHGTTIALMHSELSEALEGFRDGNPPSEKTPEFSQVEEELADTIIRIVDFAGMMDFDLPGALLAKIEYNAGREYRHGGREF